MVEAAVAALSVHLDRYRTYLPDDEGTPALTAAHAEAAARPPRPRRRARPPRHRAPRRRRRRGRRVADPLAAAHRPGHGQGRRGPGVLALRAAGVARRGGRCGRAGRDDRPRRRAPRAPRGDGRAVADVAAGRDHPRHQAGRGRTGGGTGARRSVPAVGRAGRRLVRRSRFALRDRPGHPVAGVADRRHHALAWTARGSRRSSSRPGGRPTQHTAWTDADESYERQLGRLADVLLQWPPAAALQAELDEPGRAVSLALLAVRLTAPGVADVYQGTEAFLSRARRSRQPHAPRPRRPGRPRRRGGRARRAGGVVRARLTARQGGRHPADPRRPSRSAPLRLRAAPR